MFTDSDWDNSAPTPRAQPSVARRAGALAAAVVAGLALGATGASWWWAPRGESGARVAAPRAIAAVPAPAEIIASAPPSGGPAPAAPALTQRRPEPIAASAPAPRADPAAASRRRELTWSRWYEKPRECIEDRRGERLVECANHYIRARREFEAANPPR